MVGAATDTFTESCLQANGGNMARTLVIEPTTTSQWHALVQEAQDAVQRHLDESLESYLVFLLIRFTNRPDIAQRILALDYLESLCQSGSVRGEKLRDVGDHCLLISGLFPQRASRRRVKISYFVEMGRSAYHELGHSLTRATGELYNHLSQDFVSLMDVLQTMRGMEAAVQTFSPLDAHDLWQDTGSQVAFRSLRHHSPDAIPVPIDPDDPTFQ